MVIRAEDVRRRYDETVALDGVSLSVDAGEVFALIGPNGAGKTTLIRALTGTTDAEGTVEVFGGPPVDVARKRLGLLPQEFSPAGRLTARELLEYYAGLYETSRDVETVLDDVGLTDSAGTWYENLSGGQKRRACVGTALVNDPELLILDEPTTGIDPNGRRDLWALIERLADAGTTILFSTHYMEEAEVLADRVGLLADGRLLEVDSPNALIDRHGGDSRLVVETDDETTSTQALEEAGYHLLPEERHVAVSVGPAEIPDVVEILERADIEYDGLVWRRPSLDDVYVALTGTDVTVGGEPADIGTTAPDGTTGGENP